jgi:deoxyribose-phosphate aldolase
MEYTQQQIASVLDFAVLKPTANRADVAEACILARFNKFASVCVRPCDVKLACEFGVPVSTVIGFPFGTHTIEVKKKEAHQALLDNAKELDIVLNFARLRENDYTYIETELRRILINLAPTNLKIILETCYLTPDQIYKACKIIRQYPSVNFIKTSTGFGTCGATCSAIEIIKEGIRGSKLQIKASGGIKNYQDVKTFLDLGCTRLGVSKWFDLLPGV